MGICLLKVNQQIGNLPFLSILLYHREFWYTFLSFLSIPQDDDAISMVNFFIVNFSLLISDTPVSFVL